jgi:hypothetical protein
MSSLMLVGTVMGGRGSSMCLSQPGWKVTFVDDFEGTSLNESNWIAANNRTHGPTEKQLYMADEVHVANGSLLLSTRKRSIFSGEKGGMYNFTSGRVYCTSIISAVTSLVQQVGLNLAVKDFNGLVDSR